MDRAGEARPAAPEGDRRRRGAAIAMSLLAPGLGHLAIGRPRRMVAWYATLLLIVALTIVGTMRGAPATILLTVAAGALLRIAAAIDTIRLARPATLPRPRVVLIIVVGFFAFWEIIGGYVRAEVIEAFKIPSGSMYPTLQAGDHMFASKLGRGRGYERGDVVVFLYPMDPDVRYVKRIVGVGGDRVEMTDTGELRVNGAAVPRERTDAPCTMDDPAAGADGCVLWEEELGGHRYRVSQEDRTFRRGTQPAIVPEGSVYVLGDNRDNSSDSRVWGGVKTELIVGTVTGIWWSSDGRGVRWDRLNVRIE